MTSAPSKPERLPGQARPAHLERAAGWLSAACAVHCLALPVFSALVPLMGTSLEGLSPRAELALTITVVLATAAGAWFGFARHRNARLTFAMVAALGVYLVGHALEESWLGPSLGVLGALALAAASFASARATHHCAVHLAEP